MHTSKDSVSPVCRMFTNTTQAGAYFRFAKSPGDNKNKEHKNLNNKSLIIKKNVSIFQDHQQKEILDHSQYHFIFTKKNIWFKILI